MSRVAQIAQSDLVAALGICQTTYARVELVCRYAYGAYYDGCHKIYLAMDEEQARQRLVYGYTRYEPDLARIKEWWDESCGLRFVSAVYNTPEPNDGYVSVLGQFEEWGTASSKRDAIYRAKGRERLLALARALDVVSYYNQSAFERNDECIDCMTPACALGHYAAEFGEQSDHFRWSPSEGIMLKADACSSELSFFAGRDSAAMREFGISRMESYELFNTSGCGGAGKNAIQAAEYIRQFVAHKDKEVGV